VSSLGVDIQTRMSLSMERMVSGRGVDGSWYSHDCIDRLSSLIFIRVTSCIPQTEDSRSSTSLDRYTAMVRVSGRMSHAAGYSVRIHLL
jgi:hypothetical protein